MRKYKFNGEKLVFREGLAAFRGGYENRIGFVDKEEKNWYKTELQKNWAFIFRLNRSSR